MASEPVPGLEVGDQPRYDLTPHLEILKAPEEGLSLDQVRTGPWSKRFKPLTGPSLKVPSSQPREYWLRCTISAAQGSAASRVNWLITTDYIFMGEIDFYRPAPGGWKAIKTGLYLPFDTRELTHRNFAFQLPGLDQGPVTCYLRLETRGLNPIRFFVWSVPAFLTHTAKEDYLYGICFGVLGGMILFNLFIAVSLRDRVYFHYVGYMFFALVSMTLLHGQLMSMLDMGDSQFLAIFWSSMGLFTSFAYLFMRGVLNTKLFSPRMDKLLWCGFYYGLAIAAAGLLGQHWIGRWLSLGSGIFSPWLALAAGLVSLRRGFAAARYFLVAWGVLAVAVGIFALQEVGPLQGQYWARNALLIGTALESILLSLALAARIRSLRQESEVLRQSERRFRELSLTDGLTGLFNKRYFTQNLEAALSEGGTPAALCLLMIDIDDFKRFNDTFGHDQGDEVLRSLARVMTESVRTGDLPCRWGGEEFAVILPRVSLEKAQAVAERIRQRFAELDFYPGGQVTHNTVSLGLAQHRPGEDTGGLIHRADQALYQAKRSGKNQLAMAVTRA